LRYMLQAAMVLAWPVGALVEVMRSLPQTPPVDRPTGVSDWVRRGIHMLWLALVDNVPPREYLAYRLQDPARRDRIGTCLYWPEIRALMQHLNRLNGTDNDAVQDKGRFADLCRHHGVPCIPTLALFRDGAQAWPAAPFLPDQPDLWVKDLAGSQGSGAARWRWDGNAYRDDAQTLTRTAAELVAQWRERDCLVQPCLGNHPALSGLSDGTLADFRVVSGIDRDGNVAIIAALAQLPCGGAGERQYIFGTVTDEGHIRSPFRGGFQPVECHPDTGASITDGPVPHWCAALDLVIRAHREIPEFARFAFLGWDVAIIADGPLLIETNAGWGNVPHQLGDGIPLGCTAFPAIALQHLESAARSSAPCG
jgi:hypothetical protein